MADGDLIDLIDLIESNDCNNNDWLRRLTAVAMGSGSGQWAASGQWTVSSGEKRMSGEEVEWRGVEAQTGTGGGVGLSGVG